MFVCGCVLRMVLDWVVEVCVVWVVGELLVCCEGVCISCW